MNIVVRSDASHRIGTGHVMRCLTLAHLLREHGAQVTFICREFPGHLCDMIKRKGFTVKRLPHDGHPFDDPGQRKQYLSWLSVPRDVDVGQTRSLLADLPRAPDWLIVDHYALDITWERVLRPLVNQIMVIDDLADRLHDCDLLLDQNLYENLEHRYDGLVPDHCRLLLGPQNALLRPEFIAAREVIPEKNDRVDRILIFFGGVDTTNETAKALEAIHLTGRSDITVDVVVGSANLHREQIEAASSSMPNVMLHYQVENMAELMVRADLAVGGGGTTTWERCCLGLPALVIAVAENQIEIAQQVHQLGAVLYLGRGEEVTIENFCTALNKLVDKPLVLRDMRRKAVGLVDGGGAGRVCNILHERCGERVSI
ncbi:MAG: UDP-2,4-diacetamido-2,4,6-trideoxy-beta-L-altropyranose hydrolase [bacterium]